MQEYKKDFSFRTANNSPDLPPPLSFLSSPGCDLAGCPSRYRCLLGARAFEPVEIRGRGNVKKRWTARALSPSLPLSPSLSLRLRLCLARFASVARSTGGGTISFGATAIFPNLSLLFLIRPPCNYFSGKWMTLSSSCSVSSPPPSLSSLLSFPFREKRRARLARRKIIGRVSFFFFLFVSSFLEFVARERELKLLELRREREDFLFFLNLSKRFFFYWKFEK